MASVFNTSRCKISDLQLANLTPVRQHRSEVKAAVKRAGQKCSIDIAEGHVYLKLIYWKCTRDSYFMAKVCVHDISALV